MIVSSVITIAACHQFCTIFNLNLSPTIASVIIFFGFIQACSLSCTFYKGINKLISSIEKLFKYLKPKVEEINIDTKKIRENVVRSYSISSNYKRKISITPNRPSKVRKIENRSS